MVVDQWYRFDLPEKSNMHRKPWWRNTTKLYESVVCRMWVYIKMSKWKYSFLQFIITKWSWKISFSLIQITEKKCPKISMQINFTGLCVGEGGKGWERMNTWRMHFVECHFILIMHFTQKNFQVKEETDPEFVFICQFIAFCYNMEKQYIQLNKHCFMKKS